MARIGSSGTGGSSSSGGDVTGPSSSTDKAIARYDGTTGKIIQDSKTLVQDSGVIEAQGFVMNQLITDSFHIGNNQAAITAGFSVELTGEVVVESDGELVII